MSAMASDAVTAKARRLLGSGSVTVDHRVGHEIAATVIGDAGRYEVTRRRGGWSCTCRHRGRCSHLVAVLLVCGGER